MAELLKSLGGLIRTVLESGEVDPDLKRLIGIISSGTQGCTYCTAHSSYAAINWESRQKNYLSLRIRNFTAFQMQSELRSESPGTARCNRMR